jgi:aminoglycoside 6'-N-acetyltransferase I
MLESHEEVCFAVTDESSQVVGFIEGAVHPGPKGPYGHVEGWYVRPEFRKQRYGKELIGRFELWCLHRAICLLTSDTTASHPISAAAHAGCGFRQIHELKIFIKELQQPPAD